MTQKPITSIYDCWTKEDQWLSLNELAKMVGIEKTKNPNAYSSFAYVLSDAAQQGVLKRHKENRKILVVGNGKYKPYTRKQRVWVYSPKDWVLKSVCDGFFEEREKELRNK